MDFFHWFNIEKSAVSYNCHTVSQPFFVQKLFSFAFSFSCLFICLLRRPPSSYICSHWLHLFRKFYLNYIPTDHFFLLLFHFVSTHVLSLTIYPCSHWLHLFGKFYLNRLPACHTHPQIFLLLLHFVSVHIPLQVASLLILVAFV